MRISILFSLFVATLAGCSVPFHEDATKYYVDLPTQSLSFSGVTTGLTLASTVTLSPHSEGFWSEARGICGASSIACPSELFSLLGSYGSGAHAGTSVHIRHQIVRADFSGTGTMSIAEEGLYLSGSGYLLPGVGIWSYYDEDAHSHSPLATIVTDGEGVDDFHKTYSLVKTTSGRASDSFSFSQMEIASGSISSPIAFESDWIVPSFRGLILDTSSLAAAGIGDMQYLLSFQIPQNMKPDIGIELMSIDHTQRYIFPQDQILCSSDRRSCSVKISKDILTKFPLIAITPRS